MAERGKKTRMATALEWALGGLSLAAVLAIGGYLVREGLSNAEEPVLSIAAGSVGEGRLPFVVLNEGGRTATAVAVSLTLSEGGQFVAERRLVIDYVPGRSKVEGAFLLTGADAGLDQSVAVEGYLEP